MDPLAALCHDWKLEAPKWHFKRTGLRYAWSMLDWSQCPVVERQAGKVSGAWLFTGTRVPAKALFENLEAGASIDEFLEWFPGVSRNQVEAVLQHAELSLAQA